MDKRRKILLVDDDPIFRSSTARTLEDEDYRLRVCADLPEALAAIDEMTFDVALIDIMLAGNVNLTNRDGFEIVSRLKQANEGTTLFVVSGQVHEQHLIRDAWKEHGADDYIFKQDINYQYMLDLVRRALKAQQPRPKTWNALVRALAQGGDEVGFVDEVMQTLKLKGGVPILQDRLLDVAQWLMPLIPPAAGKRVAAARIPGAFSGVYWSKGQGCAVELILHGAHVDSGQLDRYLAALTGSELHRRTKGELTVLVLERPDLRRSKFGDR